MLEEETADRDGEPFFLIGDVRCKAEGGDKLRMGLQLPSKYRVRVTRKQGEDRAEAIQPHSNVIM